MFAAKRADYDLVQQMLRGVEIVFTNSAIRDFVLILGGPTLRPGRTSSRIDTLGPQLTPNIVPAQLSHTIGIPILGNPTKATTPPTHPPSMLKNPIFAQIEIWESRSIRLICDSDIRLLRQSCLAPRRNKLADVTHVQRNHLARAQSGTRSNPHSGTASPPCTRGMPRFPPSRLVQRLPAWRHHIHAPLRVRAGIAQPLTIAACRYSRKQTPDNTGLAERLGRERMLFNAHAAIERYQAMQAT